MMNDGNKFLDDYGTICYAPRGEDNKHTRWWTLHDQPKSENGVNTDGTEIHG